MDFNSPASEHAKYLRFAAENSDRSAQRHREQGKPWSEGEAKYMDRQARRLRAMALLCDANPTARTGDINFMRLTDPSLPQEDEQIIVAEIEARNQ